MWTIETEEGKKKIRLNRMHMEEDTAKQFHSDAGTLIDFNRAGYTVGRNRQRTGYEKRCGSCSICGKAAQ